MRVTQFIKEGAGVVARKQQILAEISIWLDTASKGSYTITLKRTTKSRSTRQNRLMWLWFTIIAQEWSIATGVTFTREDVHDAYCLLFIPRDTPLGRVAGNTRNLTMEQMTEFLENIKSNAASEYAIELPEPIDQEIEMWEEYYKTKNY